MLLHHPVRSFNPERVEILIILFFLSLSGCFFLLNFVGFFKSDNSQAGKNNIVQAYCKYFCSTPCETVTIQIVLVMVYLLHCDTV